MRNLFLIFALLFSFSSISQAQKENRKKRPSKKEIVKYQQKELPVSEAVILPPPVDREGKGPYKQVEFLKTLHYPYETISPKLHQQMSKQVEALQKDQSDLEKSAYSEWKVVGPYGMKNRDSRANFSGRIRDIEYTSHGGLRIAAASGGLWKWKIAFIIPIPVPLTEEVSTQWMGAMATHPSNKNIIFAGTGEPFVRAGSGLWRTNDGGTTWNPVHMSPRPSSFFKILYNPRNANIMHIAAGEGYYRSTDGGATWTRYLSGIISDIAINPSNPNILYAGRWGDKMYKSTNGGVTWTPVTASGAPTTNVGRINIVVAPSSPNKVYALVVNNDDRRTHGIYRSTNHGTSWTRCNIGVNINGDSVDEFHWGQGWYNSCLAVSPTNSNLVFAGGGALFRSTDGFNFNEIRVDHADQHTLKFSPNGQTLYLGNDGGLFFTNNNGDTWNSGLNILPITQFGHFANSIQDSRVMIGGTQDNGNPYTRGTSSRWNTVAGDGGGAAVDPFDKDRRYFTLGVYGGGLAFRRVRLTNNGDTWSDVNNGVDDCGDWWTKVRTDYLYPPYLYSNCGDDVYISRDQGGNWSKINTPFGFRVDNITVSKGTPVIYACMESSSPRKLMVRDGSTWYNRSTGLPTDTYVKKVVPDLRNRNIAYAIMGGVPASGSTRKIFKTTNRGMTWLNVTGNLPNVPLSDLVPHPTNSNRLYTCGEFGCFETVTGGRTWRRWDNGMPNYVLVTEMAYEDSTRINGKFHVYAATYGRGIWKRNAHSWDSFDDDSEVVDSRSEEIKVDVHLEQNFPNPVRKATEIIYELPENEKVSLKLYNTVGQFIRELDSGQKNAGLHRVYLETHNLPSGIYTYELNVNGIRLSKRMVIQK